MEIKSNRENLGELLSWVLSLRSEVAFYNFVSDLRALETHLKMDEVQWSPAFLLRSSIYQIDKLLENEAKQGLLYTLAETGRDRATALLGYNQGAVIQQIYDYRKALIDEIPKLEQLFLERL